MPESGTQNLRHKMALEDSLGTVKDYFIIVREPGWALDKKRPPEPTSAGAERMMLELLRYRPNATLTLVQLTWDDNIWVQDGEESLAETAMFSGLDLPDGSVATIRFQDSHASVWLQEPNKRPRKSSGPYNGSRDALDAIVALFGAANTQAPAEPTAEVAAQVSQPFREVK